MKAVMMSIQPKWCELIASGKKTIEVRKTRPKLETPFKCYIYCTQGKGYNDILWCSGVIGKMSDKSNGKVIGEFMCDEISRYECEYCEHPEISCSCIDWGDYEIDENELQKTCLTGKQLITYGHGNSLYGWHISDLVIYDKPKELSEFFVYCDRCDKRPITCEFAYEESNENGYYSECKCDFKRPIKRPPQSWCYVEELK